MSRHLTLLGVNHRIQGAEKFDRTVHDLGYHEVVCHLLRGKDFVFEEASGCGPTVAEKIAIEALGAQKYLDVDPAVEKRSTLGIGKTGEPDAFDRRIWYEFPHEQEKRELLWLNAIQERSFHRALFVCGYLHLLSMAFRLRSEGFEVQSGIYMPYDALCSHQHSESGDSARDFVKELLELQKSE